MQKIAESEGRELRPHKGVSVQEALSPSDWRKYLNSKDHTLAFQKLFDDEIDKAGGDWKKVVNEYMFSSDAPLVNGMCGGCKYGLSCCIVLYVFTVPRAANLSFEVQTNRRWPRLHLSVDDSS